MVLICVAYQEAVREEAAAVELWMIHINLDFLELIHNIRIYSSISYYVTIVAKSRVLKNCSLYLFLSEEQRQ